jgi:hypothetical protein
MRLMSRAVALAAVLTTSLSSLAVAQRRADAGAQSLARRDAAPAVPQQPAATTTGPEWSLFGGIASGDGAYDLGFALGGSGRWHRSDLPVGLRGDLYVARHGGGDEFLGTNFDASVVFIGAMGNAEYVFPTTSALKPYAFGGVGIFYSRFSADYDGPGLSDSFSDSGMDLGIGIGGGLRFTPRFGAELRFMDIGGFTTIPVVAVIHF